jgi:hypothetical protein
VASKGAIAASSSVDVAKAAPAKSLLRASAAPMVSVSPKAGAPSKTIVSKATVTVAAPKTAPKASVLKISTGTKRPSADSLQAAKGRQAWVDVTPCKRVVRS